MARHINEEKQEQRTLFIGLLLVIMCVMGMNLFTPRSVPQPAQEKATLSPENETTLQALIEEETMGRVLAVPQKEAVPFAVRNQLLSGQMRADGRFIQSTLLTYKETTQADSPDVQVLTPGQYETALDWVDPKGLSTAGADWAFKVGQELTPMTPVVLTLTQGDLAIVRTLALDEAYMLTITDKVKNTGTKPQHIKLMGRIDKAEGSTMTSSVHEGGIGLYNGKLNEQRYTSLKKKPYSTTTEGGWLGFTDKYWQTVYILGSDFQNTAVSMAYTGDKYRTTFETPFYRLNAGEELTKTVRLFTGAKTLELINAYQKDLNIPRFDLTIDFGWFYFLTKPFLTFLRWLYALVGNMGIAILLFATLLRMALLPIATKSYVNMAKMRKIQPKVKLLQERYKDNRLVLQQEMMALYRKEKINPAGGCLPIFIQIPVFFALYKVLSVSILMRQAPFLGWIHDLSAPDPSSVFTAFGLLPWPIPGFLDLGVWPILMGLTMVLQQKMNPAPTDPTQAKMMKMLPIIFTFMLGRMASGLVIYWTWSNLLSIAQQKYIMKKAGVK